MPNLKISQFTNLATSAQSPTYLLPLADSGTSNYKMTLDAMFSNIGANTTSGQVISTTVATTAAVTNPGLLITRGDNLRSAKLWISNDAAPGAQLLLSSEIITAQGDNISAVVFNKTNQGGGAAPATASLGLLSFQSNANQAAALAVRSLGGTLDNTVTFYSTRQGTLGNAGIWGIDNWGTFRVSRNLGPGYSDVQASDPTKLMVIGNVFALNDTTNVCLHILNSTGATNQLNLLLQEVAGQSTNLFECKTEANVKTLQISTAGILSPGSAGGVTLGSAALPFSSAYIGASATNNIQLTGTATAARVATFPDASGTVQYTTTANAVIPTSTFAGLPAAPTQTLLYSLTDNNRDLWYYNLQAAQWVATNGQVFNARDFGMSPSASAAVNATALNATITAAAAGDTVYVPFGAYSINAAIAVNKGVRLVIDGVITQATAGTNGLTVTASNVTIEGKGSLIGVQVAAFVDAERAININEAGVAGSYLTNIKVSGVTIDTWGGYGIIARYVEGLIIENTIIDDVYYTGIGLLSVKKTAVGFNRVTNITGSVSANAYGIFVSNSTAPSEARSEDVFVNNNYIYNVPIWEGLDTHGGLRVTFTNNIVNLAYIGIAVGQAANGFSPENVTVTGNVINSGVTNGSAAFGITFNGVSSANPATGAITGNTVKGYGLEAAATSGAIDISYSSGVTVTGNSIYEPGGVGIIIRNDSFGFDVSANSITDVWSDTTSPIAIRVNTGNAKGTIALNTIGRGAKTATSVNTEGLRVDNTAGNSIYYLPGSQTSVTTPLVDAGNFSRSGFAFYDRTNNRYGWGVASPTVFFDIQGSTTSTSLLLRNSASGASGLNFNVDSSNDAYITQQHNRPMYFLTNNAGSLYLNANGTVSPQKTLTLPNVAVTATSGGTTTLDLSLGNVRTITMPAGNTTLALSNVLVGFFSIAIIQDSVGGRTITFPSTMKDGTVTLAFQPSQAANARTVYNFQGDGTNLYLLSINYDGVSSQYVDLFNAQTVAGAKSFTSAMIVSSSSASALVAGANGATNPVLKINAATASVATGLEITGAASGSGLALAVISPNANESVQISPKGTGIILIGDTGTATATAGAATLNTQRGTITSEALTTAAGAAYALTITNSKVTASSKVFASVQNGTNSVDNIHISRVTPGSGFVTITVFNNTAATALNGTVLVSFIVT